jgi:hypothetical protein
MKTIVLSCLLLGASLAGLAQQRGFDRLPPDLLDARPPSARVAGAPGQLSVRQRDCRAFPAADIRRRIVELAVQEWGFFGFAVVDRTDEDEAVDDRGDRRRRGWRRGGGDPIEAARVASSIGGYWAVTPDGAWIVDSQNAIWNRSDEAPTRWRYAWSAAFVSWVMCEGGLAAMEAFQRDVAHHRYIDQAIRARDGRASRAAFVAHEPGEAIIAPGDLLCTARRPEYRTLAERRRQMGVGARTHCDIVVFVDTDRILAIGGNVRGTVGLKALPAAPEIFAHLKLRDSYPAADVFGASPAVRALACLDPAAPAPWRTAAALLPASGRRCAE